MSQGLGLECFFFCSTSLPLDGFNLHFQATVHSSKQGRQYISATLNYFFQDYQKNFGERRESNLGPLGAKRERYPL